MSEKMSRSEAGRLGAIKTNSILLKRYLENPKCCFFCKKELIYKKRKNKFCDQSCAASSNNIGTSKNETTGLFKKKPCETCGKITDNLKYCSRKCCSDFNWSKFKQKLEIEQCMPKTNHTVGFNVDQAKKYLSELNGWRCVICKGETWQGQPIPLVLDHIDGHSENNLLTNLRLVCGNCDMQLPTYKSKNIGNGRAYRRL